MQYATTIGWGLLLLVAAVGGAMGCAYSLGAAATLVAVRLADLCCVARLSAAGRRRSRRTAQSALSPAVLPV